MFTYSWHSYLARSGPGEYGDWVDRGRRQPTHSTWASYLQWVASQLELSPTIGRLISIDLDGPPDAWRLELFRGDGSIDTIERLDGLVLTGPGEPKRLDNVSHPDRVLDGRTFWTELPRLRDEATHSRLTFCIVGCGETSAAIVDVLNEGFRVPPLIEIVSRRGFLYTRGESYHENRRYTKPGAWGSLPEQRRSEFIERTDRSVFSAATMRKLDGSKTVHPVAGEVQCATFEGGEWTVTIGYRADPATTGDPEVPVRRSIYSHLVSAIGFDALWFGELFVGQARRRFEQLCGPEATANRGALQKRIQRRVRPDLSLDGFEPRLHVPMLSALAQGPGFPNLSSLGLMADRVLRPYCARS